MRDAASTTIALCCIPDETVISAIDDLIVAVFARVICDADAVSRIVLTAHELLDNVVKYAVDEVAELHISLTHQKGGAAIRIACSNRAELPAASQTTMLVGEMSKAEDVPSFYKARMLASRGHEGSGLGLARIRAEAEMDLAITSDDRTITLVARCALPETALVPPIFQGGRVSALAISEVKKERFTLTPWLDDHTKMLHVKFSGIGNMSATATLALFLQITHREAIRLVVPQVVFDIRELTFLNSSCLKSFVTWIDMADGTPTAQRYRIRFLSNLHLPWQRRSLDALRSLAEDLVTIEASP